MIPHVAIEAPRARRGANGAQRNVLFFGRLWPYKGLDYLIRAQP